MGIKRNLKSYKLWDSKHKKFVLSKNATSDKVLMIKPTVSQQVERLTKKYRNK